MIPKYIILLLVIVAVKSATLQAKNIPVEVRYERLEHDIGSNLAEKVQLSEEELKENKLRLQKLTIAEEDLTPKNDHLNFIKNFDEKIQLSPEELLQSSKHLPIQEHDETLDELHEEYFSEIKSETPNKASLVQQAQYVIETGLRNLRNNFIPSENELSPSEEQWESLEADVKSYLVEEHNKLGSRQQQGTAPQNIFQNVANGFQQLTNNFVQQFQPNRPNGTSGDEGQQPAQQGPIQGFVGYFTGGVQNIVSTIQNIGQNVQQGSGNSTVLGDTGTGGQQQQPGNFFGNIFTNVQQLFQGPNAGNNQGVAGNGTQGDTPSGGGAGVQQGFFAGAISQFNQVVSNIIPVPSTQAPPAAQGDEGTNNPAPIQPQGPLQQVAQSFGNIGTAINQFIQGGAPQNKPQGSEDESSSQPPNQNFIQSIGQNIGNAFQNIQNQFRPPGAPTQKPAAGGADGSNPIVGQVSNIGNQLQQIAGQQPGANPIQNLIPGSSSSKQPTGDKPAPAPVNEPAVIAPSAQEKTENTAKETEKAEKNEEDMTAVE